MCPVCSAAVAGDTALPQRGHSAAEAISANTQRQLPVLCACARCRGLDQSVALPRDSYLQRYYSDVMSELRVGPPALLVVEGLNVSEASHGVSAVCSVAGCDKDSLLNQVGGWAG